LLRRKSNFENCFTIIAKKAEQIGKATAAKQMWTALTKKKKK